MAYTASYLNNVAGSTGQAKIWVYTDTSADGAGFDADDYFAGANDYGMTVGDIIFLIGSSGEGRMGTVTTISATESVITALTAIGS